MTIEEAWQIWARKIIYRNYPPNWTISTEGSHYEAFKAGWEAAKQEENNE